LADQLAIETYRSTREFERSEIYGLRSQLRRAAVSAATNIVEGASRDSTADYRRFLEIAFGSCREHTYLVDLSSRLGFLDAQTSERLSVLGGRLAAALVALRRSLTDR
jgi:four helix bundle protein